MTHYRVGAPIYDSLILRDDAHDPLLGLAAADFAVVEAYLLPTASPTATVTINEIGAGEYAISFTPTAPGTWVFHSIYDDGTTRRENLQSYVVETATVIASAATPLSGVSLTDIRRAIQRLLGDLITVQATAIGSPQTFTDVVNLFDSNDAYTGGHLLFVSGTGANVDTVVRIDGSSQELGTLGFVPALPAATVVGDVADLHNLHGQGWRAVEIVETINAKIALAARLALVPFDADATTDGTNPGTFDADAPRTLYAHDDMSDVYALSYINDDDETVEIPPAFYELLDNGYFELLAPYADDADGKAITFHGYKPHSRVSSGADQITVDQYWLTYAVAADLASQINNDRGWAQRARDWGALARERFPLTKTARKNNTRTIRRAA